MSLAWACVVHETPVGVTMAVPPWPAWALPVSRASTVTSALPPRALAVASALPHEGVLTHAFESALSPFTVDEAMPVPQFTAVADRSEQPRAEDELPLPVAVAVASASRQLVTFTQARAVAVLSVPAANALALLGAMLFVTPHDVGPL